MHEFECSHRRRPSSCAGSLKSLLLQTEGIEHIYTAQTGSQLGSLLALHSIHLYIIDLDLPDIDGFELIHQIKQNLRSQDYCQHHARGNLDCQQAETS